MPRIRQLEIDNFRCLRRLRWVPRPGMNALVGPGDVGKSTVLDAIDYCLGARRALTFTDADFHALNETESIRIAATVGELPETLLNLDTYGVFLRGFDASTGEVVDEPAYGHETVITLVLTVDQSLEPSWSLFSDRAASMDQQRGLSWGQRVRLAPMRLGAAAGFHFAWRQGSILNRLTSDLPNASTALASAAREARRAFGEQTAPELESTLAAIYEQATRLGIKVGDGLKAMLDAESVAFGRGTIALHTSDGIPMSCLGTGSLRLLAAGLQRSVDSGSSTVLADEIEHGLEPYRVSRLLDTLGARADAPSSQVFLTTHSPVVICELPGDAIFVLRRGAGGDHETVHVGSSNDVQGTVRKYPETLLARAVIVCEGASEVGLLRGLDQHEDDSGRETLTANGVVYVDGGGHNSVGKRALALQSLGFATAILRDSDRPDTPDGETDFVANGGRVFMWHGGRALEDVLFAELTDSAALRLLEFAVERVGAPTVDDHIRSKSDGTLTLETCRSGPTSSVRKVLGAAAQAKQGAWFKTVSAMQEVSHAIVGPALGESGTELKGTVEQLRQWARDVVT